MAAQSANLAVRIATVMDSAGLKKADKGISGLEKRARSLGKTLGIALSVGAITAFGKSAVQAFMEDEKSAAMLANTIKNLGMELELPAIEKFIGNMETATGIADDELRPAMQALLSTFKDTAKAQNLLGLATEISRGSGQNLSTVIADLNKAYTGNYKGLKKYNLGLTDAELKTMGFTKIVDKLNQQFKGSNAAFLETYAGKMKVLSTAAGTAKEIIGKGLVDALMAVTGSIDVQELSTKLIGFAQNLADAFVKIGNLIAENWAWVKRLGIAIVAIFTATKVYAGVMALIGFISKLKTMWQQLRNSATAAAIAEAAALNPVAAIVAGAALIATIVAATKAMDALFNAADGDKLQMPTFEGSLDYGKLDKNQLKVAKLNAKIAADEAKRKKAAQIFDMNQIQLIAALKGQVSKEDRARLELQLALATDNTTEVTRLTQQISIAQGYTKELTDYLLNLPEANNPFVAWKGYLDEIELQAKRIAAFGAGGGASTTPSGAALIPLPPGFAPAIPMPPRDPNGATVIKVEIDGKEIATAVQNQNNSGNKTGFSRLGDFLTL